MICLLVVFATCVVSGCATTSYDSYTATSDMRGIEKKQASDTEDMNAIEKVGYYLFWFALSIPYGLAGGSP